MQELLTYIIVIVAVSIAIYKIYLALPFKKSKVPAGKCGACSTGCALKDLKGSPECPPLEGDRFILNKS